MEISGNKFTIVNLFSYYFNNKPFYLNEWEMIEERKYYKEGTIIKIVALIRTLSIKHIITLNTYAMRHITVNLTFIGNVSSEFKMVHSYCYHLPCGF